MRSSAASRDALILAVTTLLITLLAVASGRETTQKSFGADEPQSMSDVRSAERVVAKP